MSKRSSAVKPENMAAMTVAKAASLYDTLYSTPVIAVIAKLEVNLMMRWYYSRDQKAITLNSHASKNKNKCAD